MASTNGAVLSLPDGRNILSGDNPTKQSAINLNAVKRESLVEAEDACVQTQNTTTSSKDNSKPMETVDSKKVERILAFQNESADATANSGLFRKI